MAKSKATAGIATKLQRDATNNGSGWATIAEIQSITNAGGQKLKMIDVTNMDSAIAEEEMIPSIIQNDELNITFNWVGTDTVQKGCYQDLQSRTLRNFQIIFPDSGGTQYSFAGYVTAFNVDAKFDDKIAGKMSIKPTGVITLPS
jgi:predicted secreted protein